MGERLCDWLVRDVCKNCFKLMRNIDGWETDHVRLTSQMVVWTENCGNSLALRESCHD